MACSLLVALILLAVPGCGTEPARDSSESWAGLTSCGEPGSPVAAFEGSDEGVGYPDDTEGSPPGTDLWFLDAAGEVTRVTDDHVSLDPLLSRDGSRLYFTRAAENAAAIGQPGVELWMRDVASGDEALLATAEAALADLGELAESPDGSTLAFAMTTGQHDLSQHRLFTVSTDGGGAAQVVPWRAAGAATERQRQPAWSPDGALLAYVFETYVDGEELSSVLVLDPRTGLERVVLAAEPVRLFNLGWLPDGALLVTKTEPGGMPPSTVVRIDPDTGTETVLAEGAGVAVEPASRGATTVVELGYPVERLEEERLAPVLRIWTSGEPTDRSLPDHFSFATDLTIAECAYGS